MPSEPGARSSTGMRTAKANRLAPAERLRGVRRLPNSREPSRARLTEGRAEVSKLVKSLQRQHCKLPRRTGNPL